MDNVKSRITIDYLKTKWEPGMTAGDLGRAAFLTRQAVGKYRKVLEAEGCPLKRQRRTPSRGTPEFEEYMQSLVSQIRPGESGRSFYRRIQMSEKTFYRLLPELKKRGAVFTRNCHYSDEKMEQVFARRQKMIELYESGASIAKIADKTGYTTYTVTSYLAKYMDGRMGKDGRIVGKAERKPSGQSEGQADQDAPGGGLNCASLGIPDLSGR